MLIVDNGPEFRGRELDRLGRDLRHLVNLIHELTTRGVGLTGC